MTGTLILDEDGLYDPATFNDRLLLGLKGTMSEAGLYMIRARLHGGLLNKARRAALKLHLPIGFCYTERDVVVLDPDRQVQESIRFLFHTFQRTGSASATVRTFQQEQVLFPRRVRQGPYRGELAWNAIRHDDVLRLLHHPGYAGAFVFGRTRTWKTMDGKVHVTEVPRDQWQVIVRDVHVGYICWEQYEANLAQLAANSAAYSPPRLRPPREGPALLQGLVLCGRCGTRMTVRYHQRSGQRIVPDYVCQREGIETGMPPCQRLLGRDIDAAVSALLLAEVTPQAIAVTLAVHDEIRARADDAARLRQQAVDRAQYEADLAQRRYARVDPDNRLVADVLEAEWNERLRALVAARDAAERQRQADEAHLSPLERAALLAVPYDFAQLWQDPQTTDQERKRLVRLLIEDVTVLKTEHIVVHVRFKGGATRTLTVPVPPPFAQARLTPVATLAAIDRLLEHGMDAETAAELNRQGYRTFLGLPFQAMHVSQLRRTHGLKDRYTRLREAGGLTAQELARDLGVRPQTIWRWYRVGQLRGERYNDRGTCLFWLPITAARDHEEA